MIAPTVIYRPVDLTRVTRKVMRRMIAARLENHLLHNQLFYSDRHSFRPRERRGSGKVDEHPTVVLAEFSKAFNGAPHSRLLEKLQTLGVTRLSLQWIQAFLTGRIFSVKVSSLKSQAHFASSGACKDPYRVIISSWFKSMTYRSGWRTLASYTRTI